MLSLTDTMLTAAMAATIPTTPRISTSEKPNVYFAKILIPDSNTNRRLNQVKSSGNTDKVESFQTVWNAAETGTLPAGVPEFVPVEFAAPAAARMS